jgi:hypothetical protein
MLNFVFHTFYTGLLWVSAIMMMRFSSHSQDFLVPPPLSVPLFALTLPHNLAATADAFWGMVNIDLLLLPISITLGSHALMSKTESRINRLTTGYRAE